MPPPQRPIAADSAVADRQRGAAVWPSWHAAAGVAADDTVADRQCRAAASSQLPTPPPELPLIMLFVSVMRRLASVRCRRRCRCLGGVAAHRAVADGQRRVPSLPMLLMPPPQPRVAADRAVG